MGLFVITAKWKPIIMGYLRADSLKTTVIVGIRDGLGRRLLVCFNADLNLGEIETGGIIPMIAFQFIARSDITTPREIGIGNPPQAPSCYRKLDRDANMSYFGVLSPAKPEAGRLVMYVEDKEEPNAGIEHSFGFTPCNSKALDFSQPFFIGVLQATVVAFFMNIHIFGLNQSSDIEMDEVNKPYLPLASGEYSVKTEFLAWMDCWFLAFILGTFYKFLFGTHIQSTY